MTHNVLCIDSNPRALAALRGQLERQFTVHMADSGERALAALEGPLEFAAIVSEVELGAISGLDVLEVFAKRAPDTARILLTKELDPTAAIDAVNRSQVFRILTKPCPTERLVSTLTEAAERFAESQADLAALERTQHGCMRVLSEVLASSTPEVFDKQLAVKELAGELVRALGSPDEWAVEAAAQLGRVGELGLPERLHDKTKRGAELDEDEAVILGRVPELGAKLLENLPLYRSVAEIVRYQDHRFDGKGSASAKSPKGEALPLGSRILRVARDMVDLECSGQNPQDAFETMNRSVGCYDPAVLKALAKTLHLGDDAASRGYKPRSIPLAKLRRGDVLAAPLLSGNGRMLMQVGHRITAVTLQRIRNYTRIHGVQEPLLVEDWRAQSGVQQRRRSG